MISAETVDDIIATLSRLAVQARLSNNARLEVVADALHYYIATGRCPTLALMIIAQEGIDNIISVIASRWNGTGSYAGVIDTVREYLIKEIEDDD